MSKAMYVVGQRAQHPILRRYKAKCREEKEQCFTTCQKPAQKKILARSGDGVGIIAIYKFSIVTRHYPYLTSASVLR